MRGKARQGREQVPKKNAGVLSLLIYKTQIADDILDLKSENRTRFLSSFYLKILSAYKVFSTQLRVHDKKYFSYFSTKKYVVGLKCLDEAVLLSIQNIC